MRVTALSTAGVLVKNQTTGNYSFMYVSRYFLAYKREGDIKWRHYHRNDVAVTVRFRPSCSFFLASFYCTDLCVLICRDFSPVRQKTH